MRLVTFIIVNLICISILQAGDRGCRIGIVNVSTGNPTKASKRLYELLVMDSKQIFVKNQKHPFAWNPDGSEVIELKSDDLKGIFNPMIVVKEKKALKAVIKKNQLWEGVIVFEYDHKRSKARFKLFDPSGKELALIKLPLEENGAMKKSLFKHIRRSTLTTLGLNVKFSP